MGHFSHRNTAGLRARLPAAAAAAAAAVTIGFAQPVHAVDHNYVGPASGLWQTGTNWSPAGAPVAGDNAILPQTYVGSYTVSFGVVSYSILSPLNSVRISSQSGSATATPGQDQAASSMAAVEMHVGLVGAGVYNQSAGVNTITSSSSQPGLQIGEGFSGIYNLSGGTLAVAAGREFLGNVGNGTFNQTGGVNPADRIFIGANTPAVGTTSLQGDGTYNL